MFWRSSQANNLQPAPQADKRTLCRRAYFDLTGLPPTEQQLEEFLATNAPDAWERLIDQLLASPHYGERWGRHWLDLVRFAETNSFERDGAKPNAWKYRDYVIRSFNDDKPYDQFVREQLAGDELDEVTHDSILATGYYRLGIWDDEPADAGPVALRRAGRPHRHDQPGVPGPHRRLRPVPRSQDRPDSAGRLLRPGGLLRRRHVLRRPGRSDGQQPVGSQFARRRRPSGAQLKEQEQLVEREKFSMEEVGVKRMEAPDQRRSETHEREALLDEKLQGISQRVGVGALRGDAGAARGGASRTAEAAASRSRRWRWRSASRAAGADAPQRARQSARAGRRRRAPLPAAVRRRDAGDSGRRRKAPARAGRRKVLADWIASPENLLTSRVIANRVWQHHFGRGIVRSANNFGELGDVPTHPELLDWLAIWLTEHEWKLKPLHRLIMTSQRLPDVEPGRRSGARRRSAERPSSGGSTCGGSAPKSSATRRSPPAASSTSRCTARAFTPRCRRKCWRRSRGRATAGASRRRKSSRGGASTSS